VADHRDNRGKKYSLDEIILSVVMMFLLREGSRNSYNLDRDEPLFNRNLRNCLGIRLVHGDTFNDVLVRLDPEDLQRLKAELVKILIARKVFYSYRRAGKHIIAVDATGTHSLEEDYSGKSLNKTSKNGVTSYSHAVLEAKLVTPNGFTISLASVWLENNDEGHHDKQDCERAAFKRLAIKLKELYPRLPMFIVGDALYANAPVMGICKANEWDFILVIKEGALPNLAEEIQLRPDRITSNQTLESLSYLTKLEHEGHHLSWVALKAATNSFSWITNIEVNSTDHAQEIAATARLRWKIENEGFNTQKNGGYNLQHRFSRISFTALKNYYQCLQIAHILDQLTLLEKKIKKLANGKISITKLFERLRNMLVISKIDHHQVEKSLSVKVQIRFE